MSEAKTVQKRVKVVTLRCAAPGCEAKTEGAATFSGEGDEPELVAPRGWSFTERDARSNEDVIYGRCPSHPKR